VHRICYASALSLNVARRTEILKLDAGNLKRRLASDIAPYAMILLDEHKLRFGWSFRKPGTSDLQNQLLRAWQRVPAALQASLQSLGGLASPTSPDIGHYTTYFGDDLCQAMALAQPEKAAHNADSYTYFCMKYATLG